MSIFAGTIVLLGLSSNNLLSLPLSRFVSWKTQFFTTLAGVNLTLRNFNSAPPGSGITVWLPLLFFSLQWRLSSCVLSTSLFGPSQLFIICHRRCARYQTLTLNIHSLIYCIGFNSFYFFSLSCTQNHTSKILHKHLAL